MVSKYTKGRGFSAPFPLAHLGASARSCVVGRLTQEDFRSRQNCRRTRCSILTEGSLAGKRTESALQWERRYVTACTNCSQLYAVALWHVVLLFLVLAIICISTFSLQLEEVFSQLSRKPKELLTELKELWLRTSRNELPPTFLAHGLTSKLMTGLQGHLVRVSEPHT